jgi:hypothetical protein
MIHDGFETKNGRPYAAGSVAPESASIASYTCESAKLTRGDNGGRNGPMSEGRGCV